MTSSTNPHPVDCCSSSLCRDRPVADAVLELLDNRAETHLDRSLRMHDDLKLREADERMASDSICRGDADLVHCILYKELYEVYLRTLDDLKR